MKNKRKNIKCLDCGCSLESVGYGIVGAWARMDLKSGKHEGFVCNPCHFGVKKEDEIYEWEFPEPSCCVDLERVCEEVNNVPVVIAQMYMHDLKKKAPIVYERLSIWTKENNKLQWWQDFRINGETTNGVLNGNGKKQEGQFTQ